MVDEMNDDDSMAMNVQAKPLDTTVMQKIDSKNQTLNQTIPLPQINEESVTLSQDR